MITGLITAGLFTLAQMSGPNIMRFNENFVFSELHGRYAVSAPPGICATKQEILERAKTSYGETFVDEAVLAGGETVALLLDTEDGSFTLVMEDATGNNYCVIAVDVETPGEGA